MKTWKLGMINWFDGITKQQFNNPDKIGLSIKYLRMTKNSDFRLGYLLV